MNCPKLCGQYNLGQFTMAGFSLHNKREVKPLFSFLWSRCNIRRMAKQDSELKRCGGYAQFVLSARSGKRKRLQSSNQ